MIKWLCKLFKRNKYVVPPFYPFTRARPVLKRMRYKEYKPQIPGTFVYPESWYKAWNDDLLAQGWTKKELKRGWRYIK